MEVNSMHDYILGRDVRNRELVTVRRDAGHINMIAGGWSGSGKTKCFALNMALQSILFGENVVITDDHCEVLGPLTQIAQENGYAVIGINAESYTPFQLFDSLLERKIILCVSGLQNCVARFHDNLIEQIQRVQPARKINFILDGLFGAWSCARYERAEQAQVYHLPEILSHNFEQANVFIVEQSLYGLAEVYGIEQVHKFVAEQDAVMFFGGAHNVQERRDCESFLGIGLVAQAGGGMCADIPNRKALLDMSLMGKRQAVVKISNRQTVLVNTVSYREMYRLLANGCKH